MQKLIIAALAFFLLSAFGPGDARWTSLTGKVVDVETGNVLIGAKVMVEGTSLSVYTDPEGNFEIIAPVSEETRLQIEYISYDEKVVSAAELNTSTIISLASY